MIDTRPTLFTEADFRKSSFSEAQTDCVHVARRDIRVEVRDTKTSFGTPDDHRLAFSAEQFDGFLTRNRAATE